MNDQVRTITLNNKCCVPFFESISIMKPEYYEQLTSSKITVENYRGGYYIPLTTLERLLK